MEELNAAVLRGFRLSPKKISRQKAYYICNTQTGLYVIKKSFDNAESVAFQHSLKEHLLRNNFPYVDNFVLSETGEPYVVFQDEVYICTPFLDLREADLSDKNEFLKIIEQVSLFHKAAENVTFSFPQTLSFSDEFLNTASWLNVVKRNINNQKRLSDFDVLFLKNFNYFYQLTKQSLEFFTQNKDNIFEKANRLYTVSHGRLKEENILMGSDIFLTKFSDSKISEQVSDVSSLIQRHIKHAQNPACLSEVLEAYGKHNNFGETEKEILINFLKFPEKFISICRQFYSKKRTWTPSALITRIEEVINSKERFENYITL